MFPGTTFTDLQYLSNEAVDAMLAASAVMQYKAQLRAFEIKHSNETTYNRLLAAIEVVSTGDEMYAERIATMTMNRELAKKYGMPIAASDAGLEALGFINENNTT